MQVAVYENLWTLTKTFANKDIFRKDFLTTSYK